MSASYILVIVRDVGNIVYCSIENKQSVNLEHGSDAFMCPLVLDL